jgi:diphosphomevalonate decarboxylase
MNSSPFSLFKGNHASGLGNFSVAWQSPSNIALIKYWGKKNGQLPLNPSLSISLDKAFSQTHLHVSVGEPAKGLVSVNGDVNHPFLPKMQQLFQWMVQEIPALGQLTLLADTSNSFPHSTGIASSASGLSAFALCMFDVVQKISEAELSYPEIQKMASYLARIGSGSACRSVYGGYTVWGKTPMIQESSDEYAVSITEHIHPDLLSLHDAILIVSTRPKQLSSSLGHRSMNDHPFLNSRITQANQNLSEILLDLKCNVFERLASVAENEALTLHALLMSANPGVILMQPGTIEIIRQVREARHKGMAVFFTLDAGANVHVMYPSSSAREVEQFIASDLQPFCEDGRIIFDSCGSGPAPLNENSPIASK